MTQNLIKLIIFIGLLCGTTQSFAHKIVLLTSLNPKTNRPLLRLKSWNINKKLEKKFNQYISKLNTSLSVEVIHFAGPTELYRTLRDPEVTALIWVGHAGFGDNQGLGQTRSIVDHRGRDIKSLFQAAGPHLKYMALVGCQGAFFLNEWREKGYFSHVPKLQTYGREVKTDARKGLKKAMKKLEELVDHDPQFLGQKSDQPSVRSPFQHYQKNDEQYELVQVIRMNLAKEEMEAVQILQKDRLIAFFPKSQTIQVKEVLIRKSNLKSAKKIVLESGFGPLTKDINLGRLNIEADEGGYWNLFQTPSGKPIGIGKHIYQHIGD